MRLEKSSSESRLVGLLVIVTLALGIIAIYAIPKVFAVDRSGDTVESYTVTLHADGTLDESFVYKIVSRDTRFLFRYWEEAVVPLNKGYSTDQTYLEVISVTAPSGTTAYLKDYLGEVSIYSGPTDTQTISDLAYFDEVGAFNPNYYEPGTYTVSYKYRLHFPVDSDGFYDHLNIQFAREHITYSSVKIILEDTVKATAVYPHPPSLQMTKSGSDVIITGSSAENELLEVEMLATSTDSPWRSWGILFQETNTKAGTESANQLYSTQYWTAYAFNLVSKAAVLLVPLLLLGLWFLYGREEDVTVPTYLSTVPNPGRKPWYVNLVYNKGMLKFDENGFYATLLDLDTRGKINIETNEGSKTSPIPSATTTSPTSSGGGLRIRILDTNVSDEYEKRVMAFLASNSTPDPANSTQSIFDTNTLNAYASQISSSVSPPANALTVQSQLQTLMNPMGSSVFRDVWQKIPWDHFNDNNKKLVVVAVLGALFVVASIVISLWAPIASYLMTAPGFLGVVIIIQYVVARVFPVFLMGRYKPGLYKEKLEWGAFQANLSDFSQMQKYGTEDLSMWGSWLVYGTALGVGDKVAQAMKSLNVKFSTASVPLVAHTHFHPITAARSKAVISSGGSGRSGGGYRGGGSRGGGGGRGGVVDAAGVVGAVDDLPPSFTH